MIEKPKPFVRNVASEKQVKKAGVKEKLERDNHLAVLRAVLGAREGRKILFWIVNDLCHYDADDFNTSGSITFRSLGERNIGRVLKGDCIEASHELWQKAEQENWEYIKKEGE